MLISCIDFAPGMTGFSLTGRKPCSYDSDMMRVLLLRPARANPWLLACLWFIATCDLWLIAEVPSNLRALETPLDEYIAKVDLSYTWKPIRKEQAQGITVSTIELTSQRWLSTNEVNEPIWWHWLVVYRPERVKYETAVLFINGGSNRRDRLPPISPIFAQMANQLNAVVAELRMIPNQPLIFFNDGKPRSEDDLIAYAWDKFLRTGNPVWLPRLPMTKAAVRAMDCLSEFCATDEGGSVTIKQFIVAGGSKRGWTTWTTAAVDRRVVAICPIVIDLLNIVPSFKHHYRAYGFFAPAVHDYVEQGIMNWMDTAQFRQLLRIVDPFEYRHRLTMPKLILNACGDQFFLPDSSQFYFDQLCGPKWLRYVPNTDHSLRESDALESFLSFAYAIMNQIPLPQPVWRFEEGQRIRVWPVRKPKQVLFWQATNPEARDFRLETVGKAWTSQQLEPSPDGTFVAQIDSPERGWRAAMIELTYDIGGPAPFKTTTQVFVVPDTLPYSEPKLAPQPALETRP